MLMKSLALLFWHLRDLGILISWGTTSYFSELSKNIITLPTELYTEPKYHYFIPCILCFALVNYNVSCFSLLYMFTFLLLGLLERAQTKNLSYFSKGRKKCPGEGTVFSLALHFISINFWIFIQHLHTNFPIRTFLNRTVIQFPFVFTSCYKYNHRILKISKNICFPSHSLNSCSWYNSAIKTLK